jgi:hypothetical protein
MRGFFMAFPDRAGKAFSNYLAAGAGAAGAAAGASAGTGAAAGAAAGASAAGAAAAGAGAAGAAASSFLPQADKAAAAMMAAKTRDLFMVIFLLEDKKISGSCQNNRNVCFDRDKSTRDHQHFA